MSDNNLEGLPESALNEFINFMTGKRLGFGMSRITYELAHDDTKVVKIERQAGHFQNVVEWETWQALRDTKHAKWLAPCHYISACGIFLVMERTAPIRKGEEPKLLPSWLRDHKLENYGMIGKQIVCHDYGTNLLLNNGAFSARMKKTDF